MPVELNYNSDGTAQMPFPYDPTVLTTLREDQKPRFYGVLTNPTNLPVQNIDLNDLNAMQNRVDEDKIANMLTAGMGDKPITVVRLGDGKLYIADGHHRAVAALLNGETAVPAYFKDLSRYDNALKSGNKARSFTVGGSVTKVDVDKRLVSGWASVIELNGKQVVDRQGDVIQPEELVKAAHGFITESRDALAMHQGTSVGQVVESLVFTHDVQKALGIDLGKVGWFITMKVSDEPTWQRFKSGELKAFSIGGAADVEEFEEDE